MNGGRADWVGKTVGEGRFHISRKLGEGGMGFVYQSYDQVLDTEVVIKVPRRSMLDDPEFKARFARENRALVKLQHPHIVSILFVGESEEMPYAVMQYLPGGDLKDRQQTAGRGRIAPLPPDDLATWLPGIAKALDFIHLEGFIHRDVKPANILFDNHGNVYLSDFGVAKVISEKQTQPATSLTGTGMVLGTPEYMAPELIMGENFDGRIDQYALAITVYEVLSGRTPFEGTKSESILVKQVTEQVPPLASMVPSIPMDLSDVVMRGLAKNPVERFPTCAAFADSVLGILSGRPLARSIHEGETTGQSVPPLPQGQLPPAPSDEFPLLDPPINRASETARMSVAGTAAHTVPLIDPAPEIAGRPSFRFSPQAKNLLLLWAGLAAVFAAFVSAVALIASEKTTTETVPTSQELTSEEKALAVPLANHQADRGFINSLGIQMVCISPGRFAAASNQEVKKWSTIDEPYWISQTEITVAEYLAFATHPNFGGAKIYPEWLDADRPTFFELKSSPYNGYRDTLIQNGSPITGITPAQMDAFCNWLSRRPGEIMRYSLPTPEQWVCAYRAGSDTPYYWGENFQANQCNTSVEQVSTLGLTKSFPANSWGLSNLAGNVAEVLLGGERAAGGHWKSSKPLETSATAMEPMPQDLSVVGFRIVAVPR